MMAGKDDDDERSGVDPTGLDRLVDLIIERGIVVHPASAGNSETRPSPMRILLGDRREPEGAADEDDRPTGQIRRYW